jgi:hypothetical protein
MNLRITLTVTALLTVLFSSFHLADDVVRGIEPGGTSNYTGIVILAVFLYSTLMLGERRWAHVLVLIGSLGGAAVAYLHMTGSGLVGPRIVNAGAVFFWVWTLFALGATAIVSVVLSAQRLWNIRRGHRGVRII